VRRHQPRIRHDLISPEQLLNLDFPKVADGNSAGGNLRQVRKRSDAHSGRNFPYLIDDFPAPRSRGGRNREQDLVDVLRSEDIRELRRVPNPVSFETAATEEYVVVDESDDLEFRIVID
jgi:hypothetical protein